MTKQELRKHIRTTKRQFSDTRLAELSLCICNTLISHPRFHEAQTVMLYHPLPDEVDICPLLSAGTGKTLLLPRVIDNTDMELRLYSSPEDMQRGSFGIMEPTGKLFTDYPSIDLAIVPGMAFDADGHRLGRGKGYYDRFLARLPHVYKIGVCFPFQVVEHVPTEETDIIMDEIISKI